jgi:methionine sulfoxide reductase heme-binding subunit
VNKILTSKWTKVAVFLLCLAPFGDLLWRAVHAFLQGMAFDAYLTADPIKFITHRTGDWTIRFIVITLAITPLRKMLNVPQLIRFRRMLGLYAFFYGCMHFSTWMVLDKFFDWRDMWADVHKRPFITIGLTGLVFMIPLAITSTAGWIRRLGGKRWQMLHRAIYVTAIAGVIHYYWLVKSDVRKPLEYAFLVGILLLWRIGHWLLSRRRQASGAPRRPQPATVETAEMSGNT